MRRILLLANPLFESRCKRDLPRLAHVFEQAEIKVEMEETEPNRAAGAKAKRAIERGLDAIIVCGGDGTVFDVLQGIAGSEVSLGVIPFGTGNILAQNLKIPSKPIEAARWLLAARPRSVPLGKLTCSSPAGTQSWFFAMAAGMGIHATMMEVAHRLKRNHIGRSAYFAAGLRVLFSHSIQPFELKITTAEGKILQRQASEIIVVRVADLNLWRTGGDLDFPFLRLASVEGTSRWRLAEAAFQSLFLGAGKRDRLATDHEASRYEDVLRVECRALEGFTYKVPVAVEADGEVLGVSCATIEMAGVDVNLLSLPNRS